MRVLLVLMALGALAGCERLTLSWTDMSGDGPAAQPPLFASGAPSIEEWEAKRRPILLDELQDQVYGVFPDQSDAHVISHETLDENAFGGAGVLSELQIAPVAQYGGKVGQASPFYLDVIKPKGGRRMNGLILMETFCPRWDTLPHPSVHRPDNAKSCNDGGALSSVMTYVFGRYIATPPIEEILGRGYGIAALYPSEVVPDSAEAGAVALDSLAAGHEEAATRWGAIAAWAWLYSRALDALETEGFEGPFIAWGHSRYGKAALLSAATDFRIDAVIAHQSGTGGASLSKEKRGESVASITSSYPHWFTQNYAGYGGREDVMPVDQHHLLAAIAPRPILLGNARRDVWSDPAGAFNAARGAAPAYEVYGEKGLLQESLAPFIPEAKIAFWIRPGTHGIVKEDWPAFLAFLDAQFAEETQAAD